MYWKSQEISFEKKIEKSKRWKEIVGYNERNRVSQSGFPPPSLLRGRIKRFLRLIWWKLLPRAIFGRSKNLLGLRSEKRRNIKFHWRQLNNEKKYSNCSALKLNITAAGFGFIKGRLTISTNGIFFEAFEIFVGKMQYTSIITNATYENWFFQISSNWILI